MTKMGPDDASGVIWASGMWFSFFFFDVFLGISHPLHLRTPGIGPKRRQTRRLGLILAFPIMVCH